MTNNYINNESFYNLLVDYKNKVRESEENSKPKPKLSNEIGMAFMHIAKNLANRNNFNGYSFKEEMIGDAIENCVVAALNFDPEKSKNPFAYFTQISWYAFLRRIQKEKKNLHLMYSLLDNSVLEVDEEGVDLLNNEVYNDFLLNNDKRRSFLETAEEGKQKKKRGRKKKPDDSATLEDNLE